MNDPKHKELQGNEETEVVIRAKALVAQVSWPAGYGDA